MRFFNTAGPCKPELHYMLPAEARLPAARRLIEQSNYFVLHAPRQSGKTTTVLELAQNLTASGRYAAVLVTAETGAAFPRDIGAAELAILGAWRSMAQIWLPPELRPAPWPEAPPGQRILTALQTWAHTSPRPLALFIDEIDALHDDVLISVLRQLRAGYQGRPQLFPSSLALIGLRDVRDYKVASGGSERLNTASPFNIKAASLTIDNFTAADVATLYAQHTAETGQAFTGDALDFAFQITQGQPWLVNALAKLAIEEVQPDTAQAITYQHLEEAQAIIIARQETHLDSLAERLCEPRVRNVIQPLLAGTALLQELPRDDIRFVVELGLARYDEQGRLVIANPIYQTVIPYVLTTTTRAFMPRTQPIWLRPDGRLDFDKLLEGFMLFWRQHAEEMMRTVSYHEIAPHLVLMAFLHRVVNGGGSVEREYAVGADFLDLYLRYGPDRLAIELKVWRTGQANPRREGLEQLDKYLAGLTLETGWLIIFDQRKSKAKDAQVRKRTRSESKITPEGHAVTVIYA